jgi:hypothetical protein
MRAQQDWRLRERRGETEGHGPLAFAGLLTTVAVDVWGSTWSSDSTLTLRRASKTLKTAVEDGEGGTTARSNARKNAGAVSVSMRRTARARWSR